ncbi:uncharacterized protein LOC110271463 [Arachis ipaensis]|uniref:uncharacterized protein LOC110271463 n=1 Tax=Arachis ipaensis TaxID=130454 RepID=UPI000A2B1971|nr:uncharacterized protein LOC110271463 [Arachis ipaensis]
MSHSNGNNIFVLKDHEVVQIIKTRCSSFLDNHPELNQGSYCKVVPLKLISSLLHKKVVFMVDARPVGYEMNRSVYIVQQIWDDASVINVFEAATEMNEHKICFRVSGSFLGLSEFSLRRKTVHQGYPLRSTFSMKMYKRSIENGGGFGSEIATGFH